MIPANLAIARLRRDLTVGRVVNIVLLTVVALCFMVGQVIDNHLADILLILILGVIWVTLGYQSLKGSRLAARSPMLIAQGQFDLAEHEIEQALKSFSIFRTSKLLSLHHLALLRHAQRRWHEAAELCRALLRQRLGSLKGLSRQSRLILADSLVEMGDLRGAHHAIGSLYEERLSLGEAMNLLAVQLDYLWRVNAWAAMFEGIATKVQLAELMNTVTSARVQALLALAAKKVGRLDWSDYLRRRVELLADIDELTKARPILHELYRIDTPGTQSPDPSPEMSSTTGQTTTTTTTTETKGE